MAFGQVVSIWAGVELRCKSCQHLSPVVLWPWLAVGVAGVLWLSLLYFTKSLLRRPWGWHSLLLLLLVPMTVLWLIPFGGLFLLSLPAKLLVRVVLARRKCMNCGARNWEMVSYGWKELVQVLRSV